jgi:ribosomal protein L32
MTTKSKKETNCKHKKLKGRMCAKCGEKIPIYYGNKKIKE